jgi:hypothetical protein
MANQPQPKVPAKADPTELQDSSVPYETAGPLPLPADLQTTPAFGPPRQDGEVGSLGPYRVVKEVGRGGMGVVYLGFDDRLKRKVALKVLLPKYAAVPEARDRFLREARAVARLTHDHIVTIHEADERDGVPYMAMQLLRGTTLDAYLKNKGPLDPADAARVGREIALGLAAAHAAGLVHRDVKPANVWLEAPNGRVKLLDFGLAKPADPADADGDATTTGVLVGTPAFMAPEQARGEKADHRSDLFSLGVVLYRLATGRPPFVGTGSLGTLAAVVADDPPPVRTVNPAVPEPLAKIIHRLLAKKPADRPQSAAHVADDLRALRLKRASPAAVEALPTATHVPPGADPFADIDATEEEIVQRPEPRKASPTWVLPAVGLAALAAVAVAAALGVFATPKGTLVVELAADVPADVAVTVKRNGTPVAERTRTREIPLPAGDDYTIELAEPRENVKLSPAAFGVAKNGRAIVRVRVEKPFVPVPRPKKTEEEPVVTKTGPGLAFDGRSTFVRVPTLRFDGKLPVTIEAWLTTFPVRGQQRHLCLLGEPGGGLGIDEDGDIAVGFHVGKGDWIEESGHAVPPLTRVHVAAVAFARAAGKGRYQLFLDGRDVGHLDFDRDSFPPTRPAAVIGSGTKAVPGGFFHGTMHELRVSKAARYKTDGFAPPAAFAADADTVAWYKFDEGQGAKLTDHSGNNHHGEIANGTWVRP